MRVGLTPTQKRLFDFIEARLLAGQSAPTYGEMQAHMGLRSKSSINRLVVALVERGYLVNMPNRARSLALPGTEAAHELEARKDGLGLLSDHAKVELPVGTATRFLAYCERHRLVPGTVLVSALDSYMRGRA